VAEISGDARYYLALWREPRPPTAPPFTHRVLTLWLARLSGLDAFWTFAVVTILGLAVVGALLWAVVLRDRAPRQAWLALGLFVVSPAAVFAVDAAVLRYGARCLPHVTCAYTIHEPPAGGQGARSFTQMAGVGGIQGRRGDPTPGGLRLQAGRLPSGCAKNGLRGARSA
jgi:hypothetical protein